MPLVYKAYTYPSYNTAIAETEEQLEVTPELLPANKVLVQTLYAALNPGDAILYHLAHPLLLYYNAHQGVGRDFSGIVVASGLPQFAAGDRICGAYTHFFGGGTVGEFLLLDVTTDAAIAKVPDGVSMVEAGAFATVHAAAWAACLHLLFADKKVLVLGAGTLIGRLLVQMADASDAHIVTTNSKTLRNALVAHGTTFQIDYAEHTSVLEPVLEQVQLQMGPFDYVFDCIGSLDLVGHLDAIVAPNGGYYALLGCRKVDTARDLIRSMIPAMAWPVMRAAALWMGLASRGYHVVLGEPSAASVAAALAQMKAGKLKVDIDQIYEFPAFGEAFARLTAGKAHGKLVIAIETE